MCFLYSVGWLDIDSPCIGDSVSLPWFPRPEDQPHVLPKA